MALFHQALQMVRISLDKRFKFRILRQYSLKFLVFKLVPTSLIFSYGHTDQPKQKSMLRQSVDNKTFLWDENSLMFLGLCIFYVFLYMPFIFIFIQ